MVKCVPVFPWVSIVSGWRRSGRSAREDQDQLAYDSHQKAAAAYDDGFFDDLVTPWSGVSRDNNLRADTSIEKLATLRTVFDKGPKPH